MIRRLAIVVVLLALHLPLSGCGGSGGGSSGGDSPGGDDDPGGNESPGATATRTPTPTATATVHATLAPTPTPGATLPDSTVFVITSDFQTGSFATFPLDEPARVTRNIAEIHSDAVAREHDGIVYVVNRLGADNIQALDPRAGFATLWQCSLGNGTNPHEIVFAAGDKAYVMLYERPTLAIVDPTPGPACAGFLRGTIDLSAFADADGVPEMDQGIVIGDRLYVTVQRLNRFDFFQPTARSEIVVIDVDTDTVVDVDPATAALDGIRLSATNPFSGSHGLALDPATGKILVGGVGAFEVIGDGGIERVDPTTNRTEGLFATETALGGNITDFVVVNGRHAYALLFETTGDNTLVRFDPATGMRTGTLASSRDFLVDIELDPSGTLLLLTDRTLLRPGMRLFRIADDSEITQAPIDTGLPPFDVVFLSAGDGPPDPGPGAVCGNGVLEGDEECDDGNTANDDQCVATCRRASCGDGFLRSGIEECDGGGASCAPDAVCAADCLCHPQGDVCTSTVVTIALDTPEPIGSASLVLDYPEAAVDLPGSGDEPAVRDRVEILTAASLFSGGAPNDLDDRVVFTLFSSDGIATGPLLAVTFDCLGAPPALGSFGCHVDDATSPALTPIEGVACSLAVTTE